MTKHILASPTAASFCMKNTDYYLVYTLFFTEILFHCVTTLHISSFFLLQRILIYSTLLNLPFTSALFLHTYVCSLSSFALYYFFSCFREDPRICILTGTFLTSHISGSAPNILLCKFVCVWERYSISLFCQVVSGEQLALFPVLSECPMRHSLGSSPAFFLV